MNFTSIPWSSGIWSHDPKSTRIEGNTLLVEAEEGSDYWEKTLYQFQHDNGHALLAPWEDTDGVEVSFKLDGFTGLYDQAGIMLWYSPTQWIKAGIEMNDGIPHLGAVVTNEYSDWSLSPVPDWAGGSVTLRASRFNDAVILRARTEEHPWRTIRVSRFPFTTDKKAGPFLCAPIRTGFQVAFTHWLSTRPDEDLHIAPPIVDLNVLKE